MTIAPTSLACRLRPRSMLRQNRRHLKGQLASARDGGSLHSFLLRREPCRSQAMTVPPHPAPRLLGRIARQQDHREVVTPRTRPPPAPGSPRPCAPPPAAA